MLRAILAACALAACGDGGEAPAGNADAGDAAACAEEEPERTGEGTYYDADGTGNCSFEASPGDLLVAAMNQTDYAGSAACGACAAIDGPSGSVRVRIVDRCPECAPGDIDLSPEAFSAIADLSAGRVPIRWRYVPCAVDGPLRYRFKEGSNPYWTAIQVRNHRHAVASLEARPRGGAWRAVARAEYNYFVDEEGLGADPIDLRVTDVYGREVVDEGVPPGDASEAVGRVQLPPCAR